MDTNYYQSNARIYTLQVSSLDGIAKLIQRSILKNEPIAQSNFGGIVNAFVRVDNGLDLFMAGGAIVQVRRN